MIINSFEITGTKIILHETYALIIYTFFIYIYKTELTKEQHKFYKMSFWNKKYLNGMEINIQVSFLGKRGKV